MKYYFWLGKDAHWFHLEDACDAIEAERAEEIMRTYRTLVETIS